MDRLISVSKITGLPIISALQESWGEDSCSNACKVYVENDCAGCPVQAAVSRLAAYENTGLEPKAVKLLSNILQEVGETYNVRFEYVKDYIINPRLRELMQAESDGRLIKVGDMLYYTGSGKICEMRVGNVFPSGLIVKGKLCNAYLVDDYTYVCAVISDFDKTVFFTLEEAEKALK